MARSSAIPEWIFGENCGLERELAQAVQRGLWMANQGESVDLAIPRATAN